MSVDPWATKATDQTTAPRVIVAIVTEQGVYMGDHGQDMTHALVIDPDETVAALVERALTKTEGYPAQTLPHRDAYLTLRLAVDR